MDQYGGIAQLSQAVRQSAGVVALVTVTSLVEGQVADHGVRVLVPGVDHDTAPAGVLIEHQLLLPGGALEHPLDTGLLHGAPGHLTQQADLAAQVVVKI